MSVFPSAVLTAQGHLDDGAGLVLARKDLEVKPGIWAPQILCMFEYYKKVYSNEEEIWGQLIALAQKAISGSLQIHVVETPYYENKKYSYTFASTVSNRKSIPGTSM